MRGLGAGASGRVGAAARLTGDVSGRYHIDMSHDPNENVRYPLTWPFWLSEKVAEAADARAMSVATWMREAAIEKLERTGKEADR